MMEWHEIEISRKTADLIHSRKTRPNESANSVIAKALERDRTRDPGKFKQV